MDQQHEFTLGEYLKKAREDANFSIEKFSLKTRINANILKSLEAEDFKNLPSPAYLKGFVLNYAKMFSLDDAEAIKRLEISYSTKTGKKFPSLSNGASASSTEPIKKKSTDTDELFSKSENIFDTTKQFMPFIIAAIVIAASFVGYKVVSSMINKEIQSHKSVEETRDPSESMQDDDDETFVESPETEQKAEETPERVVESTAPKVEETKSEAPAVVEEAKAPAAPVKKAEVKTKKGAKRNFPPVEFKPIPTNLYALKPNAPENKDDSLMPRSYKAKLDSNLQNIYIHAAEGETWVSYKVDEEPIQNEFIRQGKALFLQGKEIRMFFGNVNVTRIFLNNTFIDASSKTGVKTVIFPESVASKYQRPLFVRSTSGELLTSEEYIQKMNEEEQQIGSP